MLGIRPDFLFILPRHTGGRLDRVDMITSRLIERLIFDQPCSTYADFGLCGSCYYGSYCGITTACSLYGSAIPTLLFRKNEQSAWRQQARDIFFHYCYPWREHICPQCTKLLHYWRCMCLAETKHKTIWHSNVMWLVRTMGRSSKVWLVVP